MRVADISLETAFSRHPIEVAEMQNIAAKKLKRSKAQNKGADINELSWHYDCCVEIHGCSFNDLFRAHEEENKLSLDEKVADEVKRTSTVLVCSMNGATAYHVVENPPEVEQNIRSRIEKAVVEQTRINSLSPEQRDTEFIEALQQLNGFHWNRR